MCKDYGNLRTVADIKSMESEFNDRHKLEDFQKVQETLNVFTNASIQLKLSTRHAIRELTKAIAGAKKEQDDSDTGRRPDGDATGAARKKPKRAALNVIDAMFNKNLSAVMNYPSVEPARKEQRDEEDTDFLQAELVMTAKDMKDEHHVPVVVHGIVCVADFKDVKDEDAVPVVASYGSFIEDFAESGMRGLVGKAAGTNINDQKDGNDADEYIANHLAYVLPILLCPHATSNI